MGGAGEHGENKGGRNERSKVLLRFGFSEFFFVYTRK